MQCTLILIWSMCYTAEVMHTQMCVRETMIGPLYADIDP